MQKRIITTIAAGSALAIGSGAFAQAIQPGKWSMTTRILSFRMKGVPPRMATAMQQPITDETCVTPARAAEGFKAMMRKDADCTTKNVSVSGGILDAVAICKDRTMHLHGPFSPTGYNLNAQVNGTKSNATSMTMTMVAKRIGTCH